MGIKKGNAGSGPALRGPTLFSLTSCWLKESLKLELNRMHFISRVVQIIQLSQLEVTLQFFPSGPSRHKSWHTNFSSLSLFFPFFLFYYKRPISQSSYIMQHLLLNHTHLVNSKTPDLNMRLYKCLIEILLL